MRRRDPATRHGDTPLTKLTGAGHGFSVGVRRRAGTVTRTHIPGMSPEDRRQERGVHPVGTHEAVLRGPISDESSRHARGALAGAAVIVPVAFAVGVRADLDTETIQTVAVVVPLHGEVDQTGKAPRAGAAPLAAVPALAAARDQDLAALHPALAIKGTATHLRDPRIRLLAT